MGLGLRECIDLTYSKYKRRHDTGHPLPCSMSVSPSSSLWMRLSMLISPSAILKTDLGGDDDDEGGEDGRTATPSSSFVCPEEAAHGLALLLSFLAECETWQR